MRIGSRCRNEEAACSTTTIPGDIHMFKFLAKRPIMALALAGAFAAIPAQAAEEPIKIGAIYIMSGSAATYGKFAEQGITLAMDEINASGGVLGRKLTLQLEEGQGKSAVAIHAARKLGSQEIGRAWCRERE